MLKLGEPCVELGPKQLENSNNYSRKFFALYGEPEQAKERASIFSHIKEVASRFAGKVLLGPES
jgi:hypothetical protein